jgi:hypothetical protein
VEFVRMSNFTASPRDGIEGTMSDLAGDRVDSAEGSIEVLHRERRP